MEEERLRKEREARERRDVMTLGETREEIQVLEKKYADLQEQKQTMFLMLKKVLNEDEIRKKRQMQKETTEMYGMQSEFMPPQPQSLQKKGAGVMPSNGGGVGGMPLGGNAGAVGRGLDNVGSSGQLKRMRSPSPTAPLGSYYKNTNQYSAPSKYLYVLLQGRRMHVTEEKVLIIVIAIISEIEETRRGEVSRAVLWTS